MKLKKMKKEKAAKKKKRIKCPICEGTFLREYKGSFICMRCNARISVSDIKKIEKRDKELKQFALEKDILCHRIKKENVSSE
jgi:ribosomal protein S27AE